jgi:prepilin-type N-terminal cleavage/methylation domain-containing protein
MRISGGKHRSGFSLLELLVVVAIMFVIAALAIPRVMNALAEIRLRGAASAIGNLTQRARMLAVQGNQTIGMANLVVNNAPYVFVDVNNNGQPDPGAAGVNAEPQYVLPSNVTIGGGPAVDAGTLGFPNPQPAGTPVRFNARGLPCVMVGAVCNNLSAGGPVGFVLYVQHQATLGGSGVAAIAVNPTGRTTVLNWDGNAWRRPAR